MNTQESKNHNKYTRICYVLSYPSPDYIRTRTLLKALETLPERNVYKAVNRTKGIFRYFETLFKLFLIRLRHNPDIYFLGFRGSEIYWPVRFLTLGKPLIYDIFISNYDWLVNEHGYVRNPILKRIIFIYEKWMIKISKHVLTDTPALSNYLSKLYNLPSDKFTAIPVGTDEELFKMADPPKKDQQFKIFFYGTFLPLHGVDIILKAAKLLEEESKIKFLIVGRGKKYTDFQRLLKELSPKNVEHREWIEFEKLPQVIAETDLCLGGPFGGTSQAKKIITGKSYQFLAMGKATLVGKVPWETGFKDRINVLLTEQSSPEALAQTISWAYRNQNQLKNIGLNGKKLFNERYALSQIRKQIEILIDQIK